MDYDGAVMSSQAWINLAYLAASMLFIVAFKLMSGPRTAVRGNFLGAAGMAIAISAALFEPAVREAVAVRGVWPVVLLLLAGGIGAAIGTTMALKYPMTGMPQMVALLNGFGGAASAFVAAAELWNRQVVAGLLDASGGATSAATAATRDLSAWTQFGIATALAGLIGAVTFQSPADPGLVTPMADVDLHIVGEVDGASIDATITRVNGCEIDAWESMLGLLPPAIGAT